MFALMVLEGPTIALLGAFLSSMGFFSVYIVFILSVFGDILGDFIFYNIGKYLGIKFIDKFGKYFGLNRAKFNKMNKLFKSHGGKIIFTSKVTTGFGIITFITAGILNMNLAKFLKFSFLGGLVWSAFLVIIGYFFGYMYGEISNYISESKWVFLIFFIILYVSLKFLKDKKTSKF